MASLAWESIALEMQQLAKLGDTETAHSMADDLLLVALRHLGMVSESDAPSSDDIEAFIAVYESIDKWYA